MVRVYLVCIWLPMELCDCWRGCSESQASAFVCLVLCKLRGWHADGVRVSIQQISPYAISPSGETGMLADCGSTYCKRSRVSVLPLRRCGTKAIFRKLL
jgi:hypothetical protein